MTGGPGKEHGTNKPPPTGRVLERSKGDTTCPTTSQNPLWHPSWLNKGNTTTKHSESEWLAKDNPETNPITIKPHGRAVLLSSLTLSLPWHPYHKTLALSAYVSLQTIHFSVLDKSPLSGPGRGPFPATKWHMLKLFSSIQFSRSVVSHSLWRHESQHTGLPVHLQLPESAQSHVHLVSDAIQPSHPLLSPSPPAPNPSQHQGLFQRVNPSHEVAKVLEFQLQHHSFQWISRTDFL